MTSKRYKNEDTQINIEEESRDRSSLFIREEDRYSREVDERNRASYFDLPETIDEYDSIPIHTDHLFAPPPLVTHLGRMQQVWVNMNLNNGSRVHEMIAKGYRIREASTLPPEFRGMSSKWEDRGAIIVGGDLILMHIPENIYNQRKMLQAQEARNRVNTIQREHGMIYVDGQPSDLRIQNAGAFMGAPSSIDEGHFVRETHFAS
jgi:hypothetical protein